MATTTTVSAQLIKYFANGDQTIVNLKTSGAGVSITRASGAKYPTSVTNMQELADALGSLAFSNGYSNATTSAAGLMSSSDKSKLDGIASGANKYSHPSYTAKSSGFYKVTVDSTGHVSATTAVAKSDITALGISASDHTHNYAGSSSAGGAANSVANSLAIKLNGGTTEGTNLFTFNGSGGKTVNITPSAIGAAASSHGTHVSYSTDAPKANGTASAGSSGAVARADHVHPLQTSVSGNAGTASKLQTARTIALSGSVTGSASFDGSGNITISTSTNHSHNYAGSSSAGGAANSLSYFKNTSTTDVGVDDTSANAIGYVNGISLLGRTDGAMYKQVYSSSWAHEIYGDYRTGQLCVRGKNDGTWQGWRTVLDSSNYNSYAPTKTGGGASGTWGISVSGSSASCTGNSATASKATQDSAGQQINTTYIKGLSVSGRTITYTRGDGTTGTITTQDTNTTYPVFGAATSSAAGSNGLVPAPAAGKQGQYLRGDGTWSTPTNTTYEVATTSANGLMSSSDKSKLDGIAANANNYSHPNSGVTAGTYRSVTVNAQGHVTGGSNPTTLSGYGITDAAAKSHTHGNADITALDAGKITSGVISIDRLPQGALERCVVVADDTARFKLTSSNVQIGDTVKVTSTGKMYFVVDASKLNAEAGYEVYTAGSATSVPWSGVTGKPSTYPPSSHTHNYAGSSSAGGSATSAVKLDTSSAGSATQPVYFSGGKPVACTYTLGKSVPSNAVFTDTNTWRPLGTTADTACAGNDSRLSNSRPASDVYAWAKASSKPSYSWSEITGKPSTFTPASHTHNYAGSGSAGGAANSANIVNGVYTQNGGAQAPSYISGGTVRFNMMNSFKGLSSLPTYADCILMDTYTGSDVPYVTGFGIVKSSGSPRAFIAVGAKGNTSTWASQTELITADNYNSYAPTKTGGGASGTWGINVTGSSASCTGNSATASKATKDSAGQQINTTYIKGLSVSGRTITYTKGDGTTGTITTQDTNTDVNVTQSAVTASEYTNWRSLVFGSSNSGTEGFTPSTTTAGLYSASVFSCQPSTGTIKATTFKGALSGNASTATKATQDSAGQQINTTYIKGLSVSGKVITYTKGDGTTGTITTQDTNTWRPLGTTADTACAGNDSRLSNSRPASDVYAWAKASSKPSYSWSEITGKPSTFTPSDHSHNSVNDINGSETTTFAYSKEELRYPNYSYLAAWHSTQNGYELRAVSKRQFATASHTHKYAGSSSAGGAANNAIKDSAGQQIDTTYIKGLSVSGRTITYTRGDGTTGTITIQDTNTTYPVATQSANGLMSAADKKKVDNMADLGGLYVSSSTPSSACLWAKVIS